jgi:subtilisin family serine protease
MNMSWNIAGGPTLRDAIQAAYDAGVPTVTAAGNDNSSVTKQPCTWVHLNPRSDVHLEEQH